jgi:hypothetical protein
MTERRERSIWSCSPASSVARRALRAASMMVAWNFALI